LLFEALQSGTGILDRIDPVSSPECSPQKRRLNIPQV